MVKFCKNGSVATTAAVKLARGATGRRLAAIPAEHPFFSYDDWFIETTEADLGIPQALKQGTLRFHYNDLGSLQKLFDEHPDDIACVMLEPVKFDPPVAGFLDGVRQLCTDRGAVLVFDETVTGLKWALRGAQEFFQIAPDLSVWGKGLANGFSACAISGSRELMSLGGSREKGRRLFLVSTTHGAESSALAAMIATLDVYIRDQVIPDNWRRGAVLKDRLQEAVRRHGLDSHVAIIGYPCLLLFTFKGLPEARSLEWKTLLMQELVNGGVLSQGMLYPTASHTDVVCDETVAAFDRALARVAEAWDAGTTAGYLAGPPIKPVFRKFQECVKTRCGRIYPEEAAEPCCQG
jgi:glutamate-1-semialdehyde 2,1-aminomutase